MGTGSWNWWGGKKVTRESWRRTLEKELDRFFQTSTRTGSLRVLEVGCGNGRLSEIIYERLIWWNNTPGTRLFTLDIDMAQAVEASRRLCADPLLGIHFLRADLYRLPFPEGCFDYLIALNVFHWIKRREFLREAWRVLNVEGRLLVYDVVTTASRESRPLVSFTLDRKQIF